MTLVKRFAALLLILSGLLMPAGSAFAMTAMDDAARADCPHAMTVTAPAPAGHAPVGLPSLPLCCHALPTSVFPADGAPTLALADVARQPRPHSDTMPTPQAIGPDLPPPRA